MLTRRLSTHSENVYDAEVLLVFMHDLGSMKAAYTAATLDTDLERTQLVSLSRNRYSSMRRLMQTNCCAQLDVSCEVLDWAMEDHAFGVIDVNLLSHISTVKGGVSLAHTASMARRANQDAYFLTR